MLNVPLPAIIEGQDAISEYHLILGLNKLGPGFHILALGLFKLRGIGFAVIKLLGHGIKRSLRGLGRDGARTELALGGDRLIISLPDFLVKCRPALFQFKLGCDTLHLGAANLVAGGKCVKYRH